jgi:Delta3-Delta2-enoyl-CoA isomerase
MFVDRTPVSDGTVTVTLSRGKVNAINEEFVAELSAQMRALRDDPAVTAVILTGRGKFFSFGLDVPELFDRSPEQFADFLGDFCRLYLDLFTFPKPLVASINGHAVAGGCILALACDYRIMLAEGPKIALNESTLGASLFAGTVEMLKYAVGNRNAQEILLTGNMYTPSQALAMGLVDQLVDPDRLLPAAAQKAKEFSANYGPNFESLKHLLRQPTADSIDRREPASIQEFVRIWYLPETREKITRIQIKG